MGAYEEDNPLHGQVITVPEKTGYLYTPKKPVNPLKKRTVRFLIVSLLVNIILITAIIIISIKNSRSCDLNNKESENTFSLSLSDKSADEVTETKCKKSAPCEDGWIWRRGKCYYFSTEDDTWTNSEKFCNSHNASLALIDNKEELDFLFRHKGPGNRWIGLRRTEDNTAWTWTNGTLYNESLFTIQRSFEENVEHAYLNSQIIKSEESTINFRWICNRA